MLKSDVKYRFVIDMGSLKRILFKPNPLKLKIFTTLNKANTLNQKVHFLLMSYRERSEWNHKRQWKRIE